MSGDLKIKGLGELEIKLKKLGKVAGEKIMIKAVRAGAQIIAREAKKNLASEGISPNKRFKIKKIKSQNAKEFGVVLTNTKAFWYAHILERGSKAHTITTKVKKVLSGGGQIFGRIINHPGIKPMFFMRKAFDSKKEMAVKKFISVMKKEIDKTQK